MLTYKIRTTHELKKENYGEVKRCTEAQQRDMLPWNSKRIPVEELKAVLLTSVAQQRKDHNGSAPLRLEQRARPNSPACGANKVHAINNINSADKTTIQNAAWVEQESEWTGLMYQHYWERSSDYTKIHNGT